MSLRQFYRANGEPVSFETDTVIFVDRHESGDGTSVRLAPADRPTDLHLRGAYADVLTEITEGDMQRAFRKFSEGEDN